MNHRALTIPQPVLHDSANQTAGTSPDVSIVPADVAEYIADVLAELREMAQATGQMPLSMLLDAARREAVSPSTPIEPARQPR